MDEGSCTLGIQHYVYEQLSAELNSMQSVRDQVAEIFRAVDLAQNGPLQEEFDLFSQAGRGERPLFYNLQLKSRTVTVLDSLLFFSLEQVVNGMAYRQTL